MQRRALLRAALCGALMLMPVGVIAHPMPDTEIVVQRNATTVAFDIRLPFHDLLLALPSELARDEQALFADRQARSRTYFAAHVRVLGRLNRPIPVTIDTITLQRDQSLDVGAYAELAVHASANVASSVPIRLAYDAILHRVANHRALVRDRSARLIGVISYNLALHRAVPLNLPGGPRA